MSTDTPGRNDPCPCGSGRKYKRCCIGQGPPPREPHEPHEPGERREPGGTNGANRENAAHPHRTPAMQAIFDDLEAAQAGREFGSMEDLQQFVGEFMEDRNSKQREDFDGLSAMQMHRFLVAPFDSPELARFPEVLDREPRGPMPDLFRCIYDAIGEKGLKTTPKGNLPRALSRDAAQQVMGAELYADFTSYAGINSEEDYRDLFVTRNLATMAGLLRKQHGRLFRTRKCERLMKSGSLTAVYPGLFSVAATEFHWGYGDRCPELPIVQHSFLFTLRLLQRHGAEWRSAQFYEDAFSNAYPDAVEECPDLDFYPAGKMLAGCYRARALERFAVYCGLAEMDRTGNARLMAEDLRVRRLPLLESVVEFRV